MAILKALPGSAKINGKPVKGKLIQIKKSVINIDKFLEKRKERSIKEIEKAQKQNQNFKRKKKEEKLEEPKKEWKKLVPKKIPGLSFLDSIKKFISGWIFGFIAIKLIPLLPSLIPVVINLGKMVNFIIDIGGKFLNGFISFVDFGVKASEATIGFIKNLGGEKFAENFEKFAKTFGFVIDSMLILGALMIKDALSGDSGFGVGDLLGKKGLGKFFGKKAVASGLTKTAASTTATAGGAAGGTASTAAGIGAGAAAGIVAGAGLLASGLGEGIFQMLREARKQEADSYKRFKDKGWWNPMKYFWGAAHLGQKFSNFQIQILGTILDIVGAPFRYIIELIRYPFLSKEDKKKQQENLAKFDARIRESFREIVNTLSLGMLAKEKGSFGSLFGKKGTDAMGYTKDGKSVTEKKDVTPAVAPTPKTTDGTFRSNVKDPVSDRIGGTFHKNKGAIIGGALGSALGPLGVVAGAAIGSSIQKRGIKGVIGGAADFVTGGMFDFDNQNRKGAPKDFGIRRIAGGLADWATMGLTDFDKRGAGNLQFNPIFGGKDKAWGSRNEQAKRREKQSGFGLKRGIGGLLDFATLGMFDFDKQNRRGAPKGFGIKRIAGGLADALTMGATDFDKRGAGLLQYSGFTGRRMQRPMRSAYHQKKIDDLRSSEKGLEIGGETFIPGQALTERQYNAVNFSRKASNVKYNDEVLRSYAMYEEQNVSAEPEVIIVNKNNTVPVRVGGEQEIMVVGGSNSGSSEESYASYQGH